MAKFKIRNLMGRVPFLDGLRLSFLAGFCDWGSKFFDRSYKVSKFYAPGARALLESGQPFMLALHHGRFVGMLKAYNPRSKLSILMSRSRDGEIIARAGEQLGFSIARGSPAHGAVQGGLQMMRAAERGQHITAMADGPRGPIFEVKPGIVRMAQISKLPILPFTCAAQHAWYFWGWDRFLGSLWGTNEIYMYGEPIHIPDNASDDQIEEVRMQLQSELLKLRETADTYYGAVEQAYGPGQLTAPNLRVDRKKK